MSIAFSQGAFHAVAYGIALGDFFAVLFINHYVALWVSNDPATYITFDIA